MKNLKSGVEYSVLNKELIHSIKPLWEQLNSYHEKKSVYFKEKFRDFTFEDRIERFLVKSSKGEIRIEVARVKGVKIGYSLSSIVDGVAELDCIYIKKEYRGYKVGEKLIRSSLNWMEEKSSEIKRLVVASGNDEVLSFYRKFGFQVEYMTLRQVE